MQMWAVWIKCMGKRKLTEAIVNMPFCKKLFETAERLYLKLPLNIVNTRRHKKTFF